MKDAKIVALSTEKNEYRFSNFVKYCLINKNKKVDCEILLGQKNENSFAEKFLEENPIKNICTKITRYEFDQPAYKRTSNMLSITEEEIQSYRWFIFIDDDTITDVDTLIKYLDEDFNHKYPAYVTSELNFSPQYEERIIAEALGKKRWYSGTSPAHEWEIACVNQKALQEIMNNPLSKKFLNLRHSMKSGWGDHFLGITLRFCQIYPWPSGYMTSANKIYDHTIVGGGFCHVHQIYNNMYLKPTQGMSHIFEVIHSDQDYNCEASAWLTVSDGASQKTVGLVQFNKNKTITASHENNNCYGFWSYKDDQVYVHLLEEKNPLELKLQEKVNGIFSTWELYNYSKS